MEPAIIIYPASEDSKRVLVMLHGLGNSILPFSDYLSRHSGANPNTTVVVVTYGVYFKSFEELTEQLWNVLSGVHLTQNLVLFGYSMGGFIAQVFAKQHPQAVAGMVLACTACASYGSIPLTVKGKFLELVTSVHRLDAKAPSLLPKHWFLTEDEVFLMERNKRYHKCLSLERNTHMHAVLNYMSASKNVSVKSSMQPLRHIPTLILHGTKDSVLDISGARAMHRALATSSLRVFRGAGHGILARYPETVSSTVHDWLQTLPLAATAAPPSPAPSAVLQSTFSFAYVPFAVQPPNEAK